MAATITINLKSGTTGKLYADASSSSSYQTYSTQPGSTITISCEYPGASKATVTLRETSDGTHIANCPMIVVDWNYGGRQSVLFSSTVSGKPMAKWTSGSSTISYSSITVNSGETITVEAIAASGTVDTTAPSDIGIAGYYYAHNGLGGRYNYSNGTYTYEEYSSSDAQQGIRSKPARCGNGVPVDVSFKYNGTAKYFIYMMMRGWSGASSQGCPGDMGILAGSGPIVNSTFKTAWGTGYDEYRMDVFALSASGIYPSLDNMPGDGPNVTTCPSNSTWVKWPADSSLSTYSVTYYATNGSTILRSNTESKLDLQFDKVTGSAITFYKGTELYKYLSGDSGTLVIPSGKRFKGWQKSTDGGSTWSNTITSASNMGKVQSSNVRLKLVVEDNNVDITFKPNYPSGTTGTGTDVIKNWTIGSSQTQLPSAPAAPTKIGYTYTFKGWFTAASGGSQITSPYTVPSTATTLYAQWNSSINSYTLTTSVNSSTMGSATGGGTYNYNTSHNVTATANTGYRFVNWTLSGALTGTYTNNPHSVTMPAGNVTAKATFEAISYTILYNLNGGSSVSPQSYNITTNLTLAYAPIRTGYTFAGWKVTTAEGSWTNGTIYTSAQNLSTGNYGNVTLTAQWNINSYELTTQVDSESADRGTTSGDGTKVYNSSVTVVATPNTGYDFVKWVFTGGRTGESTSASDTFNMPAGDVTATAHFAIHNYSITYVLGSADVTNPNPSTYTIEDENILLADPVRPGYVFLGWSPQGYIEAGSHGDVTFTANWFKEMGDFTPKPGHDAEDNGDFGIDTSELEDNENYQLILELPGDRANYPYEYTDGIDYAQYGISVEENKWVYDSGVITGAELKALLTDDSDPSNTDYIFPMDVWRCRINHSRGELTVTLNLYDSTGENILGSTSATREFALESENKPHITKVELHEGVVNIKNLDLGANDQESTRRFIGNRKSSVLATIFASNIQDGIELLYEAIPSQFIVRLDGMNTERSDAAWDTGDVEVILTQAQIAEFVANYNGGEMEYPCEDILITEEPFPSINSDLPNARLRIKIWDSRRE